jgi:SAM-dependent methyltransferase
MSALNGSLHSASAPAEPTEQAPLDPVWREHFLNLIRRSPRFDGPRRYLQKDLATALGQLIHHDASVLEAGVGAGKLLGALPNEERWGVDILQEAVHTARELDPTMHLEVQDATSMQLGRQFDAIICDRLCHSVPDIQQLLENLGSHLAPNGRLFLVTFNFLWAVPLSIGEKVGFNEPSPPQNWLSASDLDNLFALTGLESIRFDDRLLVPMEVPFVTRILNRYAARLPPTQLFSVYRIYTLRKRQERRATPKVSVVIPARNEAGNIDAAIRRTPMMGTGTEIIFVEGGSSDGTREKITQSIESYKGPLELKFYAQTGKGKGDAVRTGFAHASGDLLMILDADLTVVPEDLPKFYECMVSGVTDYVHGTRLVYPMEDKAMRFLNKLGNAFFAKTFSFLLDQPIKDTLCGTKVLWNEDYKRIVRNRSYFGDFDPFGDFDLIFGARKINLKITEIPIRYRNRTYGETNISRFRHGLLLLRMCAFASRKLKFI